MLVSPECVCVQMQLVSGVKQRSGTDWTLFWAKWTKNDQNAERVDEEMVNLLIFLNFPKNELGEVHWVW